MSLTHLTARALFDPEGCSKEIRSTGDPLHFESRPVAEALGVSYPTFLRVLARLGMRDEFRKLWINRRRMRREAGK